MPKKPTHSDEKADKALIKKMVKPADLKKSAEKSFPKSKEKSK
jgi:hypothetical protein